MDSAYGRRSRLKRLALAAAMLTAIPGYVATAFAEERRLPPKAAVVAGTIEQVELSPIFGQRFFCVEHAFGELEYVGDALGTDCLLADGVEKDPFRTHEWRGFLKLYRTDGMRNEDWYGWKADVLSPIGGQILSVSHNPKENSPGTLGSPPGGGVAIRTADGIVVRLGHLTAISVVEGETVRSGQRLGKVGNNGQSRAPHTHIGAYRENGAVPLQIRWDLRAMSVARKAAGVPGS